MRSQYSKKKRKEKDIARRRIRELLEVAEKTFKKNKTLSKRCVSLAIKISQKYKTRIPPNLKRKVCKHCKSFLYPGINCRIRNTNSKIVYTCLECNNYMRFPIPKKR